MRANREIELKRSLRSKIMLAMLLVVVVTLLCAGLVVSLSMRGAARSLLDSNQKMAVTSREKSSESMEALTRTRLLELAGDKADNVDALFVKFEEDVRVAASAAARIWADPEEYGERTVPVPIAENHGQLSVQLLYAYAADPNDAELQREIHLMANIQDTLMAINENNENMVSNYIASESGFMIQADYIAGNKFDENGYILPFNAKARPWYLGAMATGDAYFTPVTKDAHTPRMTIMCGVPIYVNGELKGVSGAGMYLDSIEKLVQKADLEENENACIINQFGQVLFSTYKKGSLAAVYDEADLRKSTDEELARLTAKALSGESGVEMAVIDGETHYVAYAPMKKVGWSFFIFLSKEDVEAPTQQLVESLDEIAWQASQESHARIARTMLLMIAALAGGVVVALLISFLLSRRIVSPIRELTDKVRALQGEDLDLIWNKDTGDETQQLADSFQSLTKRMKAYISDIRSITAERERISTELSLAARIQEDTLPNDFPAFPDRREFDLYALMDPAKEVGGDFYDFFLIDEDHLALVMADVSGKGVPAALFMMASKIILANSAMLGQSPGQVLENVNNAICSNNQEEMFVTVWLGVLELSTGKITAANAGHEFPAVLHPDGAFELFRDKHGFVIGGMAGMRYREYTLQLEKGAKLFLYTDGVPEATNAAGELFGTERMLEALNAQPGLPPEGILAQVREAVDAFVDGAEQFDDLTMLCLEYKG